MDENSTHEESTSQISYVEEKHSNFAISTPAKHAISPNHVTPAVKEQAIQSNTNFDDTLEKFILAVTSEPEDDEYTLFAQSIGLQLRKLPEVHSLKFMMSVQEQLTDQRIQILNSELSKKTVIFGPLESFGLRKKPPLVFAKQKL